MSHQEKVEESGFVQKRLGNFDAALRWYVQEYAQSFEKGYLYPQELCFEQIMDILLMMYVRDRRTFGSVDEIMEQIEQDVKSLLMEANAYREEELQHFLTKGREKFAPRGRRKGRFSVDKDWLIAKKTPKAERKAG
ncbi:MAG: hypothetical protein NTZ05_11350 [Chloroflexi bacterium]|nr:hypothetical protein [Chloroflexota bacterium]